MKWLTLVTAVFFACSAPSGPPRRPTMLHVMNASTELAHLAYRPLGLRQSWHDLGTLSAGTGRCIAIDAIGPTIMRARAAGNDVRDSANLARSPDWRWDFDLRLGSMTLDSISTICVDAS